MDCKRVLQIVVASPGDVQAERNALPGVIDEINRGIAAERGLTLELRRWESDAFPGFLPEGPQGLIDTIFDLVDRFSPSGKGTHEITRNPTTRTDTRK